MLPKKIYLNYVDADDDEKTWSDEPVGVADCDLQSREYTDLSQVWHPAEETPDKEQLIWYRKKDGQFNTRWTGIDGDIEWFFFADYAGVDCWAYVNDLLPSASCSGFPNNSSKKSNS